MARISIVKSSIRFIYVTVLILDITDIRVEGRRLMDTINQNRSYIGRNQRATSLPVVPACPFVTIAPTWPTG